MEAIKTPTTLEECFTDLDNVFQDLPKSKEVFKNITNEYGAAIMEHNFLGRMIRNLYNLWYESPLKTILNESGITHPDNMSHHILVAYHRYLNGKEINLSKQKEEEDYYLSNKYSIS
jgi:hypothetical protein